MKRNALEHPPIIPTVAPGGRTLTKIATDTSQRLVWSRMAPALIAAVLLWCSPARAAIALLDTGSISNEVSVGTTSISLPATVSSGASVLVVTVMGYNNQNYTGHNDWPNALAWGSQNLTKAVLDTDTVYRTAVIYYLWNPAPGSGNITGTLAYTGTIKYDVSIYTLTGVDPNVAPLVGGTGSAAATSINFTINSVIANSFVAVSGYGGGGSLAITPSAGTFKADGNNGITDAANIPKTLVGNVTGLTAGGNVTFTATANSGRMVMAAAAFAPQAGAATQLVMAREPSSLVTAGTLFATQPVVYVKDANGTVVTSDNSAVTASVNNGTGPLSGTTTVNAVNGVATFSGLLAPATPQTGLTLTFSDGSLTPVNDTTSISVVGEAAYSWTNTVSGNWSGSVNWNGSSPTVGGALSDVINFNQSGTYSANNDLAGTFLLNQINFGGANVTLTGNGLLFTNVAATLPALNQTSAASVTVSNSLTFSANVTVGGGGSGAVTLAGGISGTGGLIYTNPGVLTLSGAETYSGGTTIRAGDVEVLGSITGAITFDGVNHSTNTLDIGATSQTNTTIAFPGDAGADSFTTNFLNGAGGTLTINGNSNLVLGRPPRGQTTPMPGWMSTCPACRRLSSATAGAFSGPGRLPGWASAPTRLSASSPWRIPTRSRRQPWI